MEAAVARITGGFRKIRKKLVFLFFVLFFVPLLLFFLGRTQEINFEGSLTACSGLIIAERPIKQTRTHSRSAENSAQTRAVAPGTDKKHWRTFHSNSSKEKHNSSQNGKVY